MGPAAAAPHAGADGKGDREQWKERGWERRRSTLSKKREKKISPLPGELVTVSADSL